MERLLGDLVVFVVLLSRRQLLYVAGRSLLGCWRGLLEGLFEFLPFVQRVSVGDDGRDRLDVACQAWRVLPVGSNMDPDLRFR